MTPRVLIVEDEAGIRLTLADRLRSEGYAVETVADGQAAYNRAGEGGLDLIVLDWMLPGKPGIDVCRDLREDGVSTPVLMLTAKGRLADRVNGLRGGADDYLVKPFEMPELLARVEAVLRRSNIQDAASDGAVYRFGKIRVDAKQSAVFRNGNQIQMSLKEYELLLYFVQHRRQALSRNVLLREVWNYQATLTTRTVDVHVGWLRQKIEKDPRVPRWIVTRHGIGYIFDPE